MGRGAFWASILITPDARLRALVNKHIPQPIGYVALSSQKNYCSLYLMGAF